MFTSYCSISNSFDPPLPTDIRLYQDNDGYYFNVPFAGYGKEEISATLKNGVVELVADNKKLGKITKKYQLHDGIGNVKLSYSNGLLTIRLVESETAKKLEIS